jgi:hypothetical protein
MTNSYNNIDQKTEGYFTEGATSVRKEEITSSIAQNYEAEVANRDAAGQAEKAEKKAARKAKVKRVAATLGATALAAVGGMLVADSDASNQEAIKKNNAPVIEQIQNNVRANEMQQKAETIGADQTAASAEAEKQVIDAANAANHSEVEATNQAIIDANR